MSFEVSDAVHVESQGKQLEGVVAFTGQVHFAEGDDWVGVRLTGASVGLGKNNGEVKGQRYFTCGPNGGVFVRASNVSKRVLTKLEELRLKRELSKIGASAGIGGLASSSSGSSPPKSKIPTAKSSTTTATTPQNNNNNNNTNSGPFKSKSSRTLGSPSPRQGTGASAKGGGATSSARKKGARSKLDELRERREALAKSRGVSTSGIAAGAGGLSSIQQAVDNFSQHNMSAASSLTASRAPSPPPGGRTASDERVTILTRQAEELETNLDVVTTQLKSKEHENESLQQSLAETQQSLTEANQKVEAAQEELVSEREKATQDVVSQFKEALAAREGDLFDVASHYFTSGNVDEFKAEIERLQDDKFRLEGDKRDLTADVQTFEDEVQQLRADLVKEREGRIADSNELTEARSAASALEHELKAIHDKANKRGESDASHYKAQAKLQAEIGAAKRTIEQMENEKLDMETTLEELALDKEQLQEEKEGLEDRLEELRIDSETAQMEVEELKLELEDVRTAAESAAAGSALESAGGGAHMSSSSSSPTQDGVDAADVAQALGVQNARLREALIRLREQSSVEKMELSRQLRATEKEATAGKEVAAEVETLRSGRANLEEQINDLKEMVEQGSAFESMVEDLSDRVMALEDANVVLQTTIAEMEEAADVTAEMEEVQADESKYLMQDLEGRDALIRNLEEAIRMQRRREEDFQRTVTNYRNSVETLKQEKTLLLELQQGEQGEKTKMMASSQKALERAALLVSDAANVRKKEAEAAFDRIESLIKGHLAERVESFLPQSVVGSELASAKGELLLSKVVGKASLSLDGIATIFTKKIRGGMNETLSVQDIEKVVEEEKEEEKSDEEEGKSEDGEGKTDDDEEEEGKSDEEEEVKKTIMTLSDDANQGAAAMIHQSKFALKFVDVAADMLRLLSAGQWPDLLSQEQSAELGAIAGHSVSVLDLDLSQQLKLLKEEGVLSPHQTNLGAFEQSVRNTMQELNTSIENDDNKLLSPDWKPPGWELFKSVSVAKFSCLGAGAVIASAVGSDDTNETGSIEIRRTLKLLMAKLDQVSAQATKTCLRLSRLNVNDEKRLNELSGVANQWKDFSVKLLEAIQNMMSEEGLIAEAVQPCEEIAEEILRTLVNFSAALRAANLNDESQGFHPLSPEIDDPWEGVRNLAQAVRVVDGDAEDVNCLMRARAMEERLEDAMNNEPRLTLANAKVASLEKSLSSRSREIAMQNARLTELDHLLAKTNAKPSPKKKSVELSVSEEMNKTKEENRMLTEAMEVLQTQVDDYERELRFFKDTKSPKGRRAPPITSRTTPRRSSSNIADYASEKGKRYDFVGDGTSEGSKLALEAALLRPALQAARLETAAWKSKAFGSAMLSLPALNVPGTRSSEEEKEDESDVAFTCSRQLEIARAEARIAKASISLLNLNNIGENATARTTFQDMLTKQKSSLARLEKANTVANQLLLSKHAPHTGDVGRGKLVGKVSIPSTSGISGTHKIFVTSDDLSRLNMNLLR